MDCMKGQSAQPSLSFGTGEDLMHLVVQAIDRRDFVETLVEFLLQELFERNFAGIGARARAVRKALRALPSREVAIRRPARLAARS